jgi:hypothetical protein
MRYLQKAFLPGDATYLLGLIRDHKVRSVAFGMPWPNCAD